MKNGIFFNGTNSHSAYLGIGRHKEIPVQKMSASLL